MPHYPENPNQRVETTVHHPRAVMRGKSMTRQVDAEEFIRLLCERGFGQRDH